MQLVEQHIIRRQHRYWQELDTAAFFAKNIYNAALYLIPQHFIHTHHYLNYRAVEKYFKQAALLPDQQLPLNTVQQVLKQVDDVFKAFFAAHRIYKLHPAKFTGRPKLPKYKAKQTGRHVVVYTRQSLSKPLLRQQIIKLSGLNIHLRTKVKPDRINQVRIVPRSDYYIVEVVYIVAAQGHELAKDHILGIDIGVDNIATLTANQTAFRPVLINGRGMKSINQWYNKRLAWLQAQLKPDQHTSQQIRYLTFKRNQRIHNQLHHISRYIIRLMQSSKLGTLVIGKNDHWKQTVQLGAKNNQNFVAIPHSRLIEMLKYKGQLVGIEVRVTQECYTSICSFLDQEAIGKQGQYQGKRTRRAEFVASTGQTIHADVNASLNIIRKVFPDAFSTSANEANGIVAWNTYGRMPLRVTVV